MDKDEKLAAKAAASGPFAKLASLTVFLGMHPVYACTTKSPMALSIHGSYPQSLQSCPQSALGCRQAALTRSLYALDLTLTRS